mmetsp:Transcript_40127/g.79354  ORF Transcript_40127/g.79354 Transcript_40127/m.79354 type:complete len:85 (-) Transcript_40127:16-270(-)
MLSADGFATPGNCVDGSGIVAAALFCRIRMTLPGLGARFRQVTPSRSVVAGWTLHEEQATRPAAYLSMGSAVPSDSYRKKKRAA